MKTGCFFQAKKQVHILNRLAGSTFQQVVNNRSYQHLFSLLTDIYVAIVSVHLMIWLLCL